MSLFLVACHHGKGHKERTTEDRSPEVTEPSEYVRGSLFPHETPCEEDNQNCVPSRSFSGACVIGRPSSSGRLVRLGRQPQQRLSLREPSDSLQLLSARATESFTTGGRPGNPTLRIGQGNLGSYHRRMNEPVRLPLSRSRLGRALLRE